MRRTDREIKRFDQMLEILNSCDCCRIGCWDGENVYIVPLNFGYEVNNETLILYFHSAKEGRKIDLIKQHKTIGFEMDTRHELVEGATACGFSYRYQSIIGTGAVSMITDRTEKIHGLTQIMSHYSPKQHWNFSGQMIDLAAVMKVEVTEWSCKQH